MPQLQNSLFAKPVLDRISDGVFSLNLEGKLTYINQAAVKLLNVQEHLEGLELKQFLHKRIEETFQIHIRKALQTQQDTHFEIELDVQHLHWVEVCLYPADDGITVFFKDITSRKKVKKAFRDQILKLELLNETANHFVYKKEPKELLDSLFQDLAEYLDLDVYFNYIYDEAKNKLKLMNFAGIPESVAKEIEWLEFGEAVCGTVAFSRERMVVDNIDMSEDEKVQLVKGFGIKAYACQPLIAYGKLIGTLSFGSSNRSKFSQEELDLIYSICNQVAITLDRIFLISKLTKKMEEAESANKAKLEFLSMISHELRTPLNSIIGFSQILEDDEKDPLTSQQKDKVLKILKSSRHLLMLINDILELSRMENNNLKIKLEEIQFDNILKECLKMIQPLADKKSITIFNEIDPITNKTILADPTRLTQVILNLLSNAVKYTQNHGRIVLSCEKEENLLKISIKDNGIGILQGEHENIFKPFYRIFNREMNIEGTGIGLALVKQFIQEMKGAVGVESEKGEGSHFWFTIPLRPKH